MIYYWGFEIATAYRASQRQNEYRNGISNDEEWIRRRAGGR